MILFPDRSRQLPPSSLMAGEIIQTKSACGFRIKMVGQTCAEPGRDVTDHSLVRYTIMEVSKM